MYYLDINSKIIKNNFNLDNNSELEDYLLQIYSMRMDHVNYVETNDNILLNKEGELFLYMFILIKNIEEKLISSSLILKTNIFEEKEKIKKILKKFEKFWIKFKKENLINFKEEENKLEIYKILIHKLINISIMIDRVPFSFEKIELNENFFENQVDRLESFLFHFLKTQAGIILQ